MITLASQTSNDHTHTHTHSLEHGLYQLHDYPKQGMLQLFTSLPTYRIGQQLPFMNIMK